MERGRGKKPTVGEQLNTQQRAELDTLLEEFREVLNSRPGRTSLTQHRIDSGEARPVKLPPYRMPHAFRTTVETELQEILDTGIIEPSRSEWASPIVLVHVQERWWDPTVRRLQTAELRDNSRCVPNGTYR